MILKNATSLLVLAWSATPVVHAQLGSPPMPVDTVISDVHILDLLYRNPPETVNLSREKGFACVFPPQPEYPGGNNAMYKFIEANLRMPTKARKAGISGKVFLGFVIEVTGGITHVSVLKGLGFGCDEEAVRLVESMPRWKPGKQDGKPVRARYNLPILFITK